MNRIIKVNRRIFRHPDMALRGGLIIAVVSPPTESEDEPEEIKPGPFVPNAFVQIGTDDMVTIIVNKSEMGQGVYTSLPMLVTEELECDWEKIRVEAAPVDPAYNHVDWVIIQVTGGSSSVRSEWERYREAGATAREMLLSAAAEIWNVDKATCYAEKSKVYSNGGKMLTFGQLAEKAAQVPVPEGVVLKDPSKFKIIGKPTKRRDALEKINGKAIFGLDAWIPGTMTALIARSPVFGGKVKSVNADKARAIPGVQDVIQVPSGVAVIADGFWPAKRGRDVLEIEWAEGEGAGISTEGLREQYKKLAGTHGQTARSEGDADLAFRDAAKSINAEYEVPYLAHAPMEPLNCLVDFRGDHCEIWTGSQLQTVDRDTAAEVLGLKPDRVELHTTFLGGGFGRRANPRTDFVVEAAEVAKIVKKPVKVVWTREDDIKGGYYRPMWYDRISAAIDAKDIPVAWQHTIVGQSILEDTPFEAMIVDGLDETSVEGANDIPYDIPNILVDLHTTKIGVPVLWWRSVGHSHTAFVVETFIDELAHLAGKDPYEFRRPLLANHPRHRGVLDMAARKAGWGKAPPSGRGRGIAVHESFGSFIAYVAEVSVSDEGKVRVHKVVCAIDCGRVVNPETVVAQMEGGMVFGLSAALYGAITLRNGRVEQGNFNNYRIVHMNEMPEVEVHIVPSEEPIGGVGEPGVPPIAPAVANAVFAVTGKRIRKLPIDVNELKKA